MYNESAHFNDTIVEQITAEHQQKSKDNESDEVDTPEQVTRIPRNLLLNNSRRNTSAIYIHNKTRLKRDILPIK
jgi:hypothetical protein